MHETFGLYGALLQIECHIVDDQRVDWWDMHCIQAILRNNNKINFQLVYMSFILITEALSSPAIWAAYLKWISSCIYHVLDAAHRFDRR